MHSQSACFIWFRGSSEYVCIFLLISAYICACFFLNFFFLPLLFLSLLGPFLSLYFSRLLLNLSFCFVKWNSCDFRLIRSFIVSNFSWHRWMHSVANIIALYSVLLFGLVFLCLLIFFFSLSSHYDALLLILFSSEFLFFFNSTDTEKNAMFAFVSFHKTGVKWPKKTNAMRKREEKKSNNNNQPINKFVFVRVAPFMRRSEKLTTKIKSETFKWNKRKKEKEANEKWTKQKRIFRSKSTRK